MDPQLGQKLETSPAGSSWSSGTGGAGVLVESAFTFVFTCAFAFALHILVVGRSSHRHSIIRLTLIQIVTATIILGISTLIFEPHALTQTGNPVSGSSPFLGISNLFLLAALATGLFATALAFLTQIRMQRETTPTHTAVIFAMEPVFAALFSVLVRGEKAGFVEVFGAVLILIGMLSVQLGRSRQTDQSGPPDRQFHQQES